MKNIIKSAIFLLVFNSFFIYGQKAESNYRKLERVTSYQLVVNNDSIKPFYISSNPITNREYITYLCWIAESCTYYPEVLLNAFPGLQKDYIDSIMNKGYQFDQFKALVYSNCLSRDYVFNPEYIDFPVIGITWKQAMDFFTWFSDRYNESILIRKGYIVFQTAIPAESSFSTEAYMSGNYVPIIRKVFLDRVTFEGRPIKWEDRILFPSFRLPSRYELELITDFTYESFIPHKANRFLDYWIKKYIFLSKNNLTLSFGDNFGDNFCVNIEYPEKKIIKTSEWDFFEFYLDYKLPQSESDIIKIFSNYNQPIVSSIQEVKIDTVYYLGRMPYMIISEDCNSNPIYIQRNTEMNFLNESMNLTEKPSIFRYALNAVKK